MTTRWRKRNGGQAVGAVLTAWAAVAAPIALPAQSSLHLAAGVRHASTLVHDSIGGPVDLRPALAPTVLVTVRDELRGPWSVDATLDVSPGRLRRHETAGAFSAGSFTAFAFSVGLQRRLGRGVSARVAAGALKYAAAATGVFREGSGGLFPLGGLAVTYAPAFGARRRLEIEARYDLHRFITPALKTEGFTDGRPVHRVALLLRLGWGPRAMAEATP